MEMWIYWLIIAGFSFVLEIFTVGFLVFWVGIGALLAMVVSFFTSNLLIQVAVFVVSSIIFIFLTKPFIKKYVKSNDVKTNVYTILDKKALVTEEINPSLGKGQIKVDSDIWSAKSDSDEIFPLGSEVIIDRIEGVKAVVKKS